MPYKHRFLSFEDFAAHVRKNSPEDAERIISHEQAHFEKATELGYQPFYAIWGTEGMTLAHLIDFDDDSMPVPQDLIRILLAPQTPGEDDIRIAARLLQEAEAVNSLLPFSKE